MRGGWAKFAIFGHIIHKVEPRNCRYVLFGMTVIKVLYFTQIPTNLTQTATEIFVVRFRNIVSAIIYYLVHF